MKEIIESEELKSFFNPPNLGDIVKGKILNKEKSTMFLDLDNFGTGIISGKEFSQAKNLFKNKNVGDEISARVIELDDEDGYVKLSVTDAQTELSWINIKEAKEKEDIFTIRVLKVNKGGLMAEAEGIPAFLPVSQLSPENYPYVEDGDQAKILQKLQKFIGQELKVKILSIDSKQKSLILSEKKAKIENIKQALKKCQIGGMVKGEITGVVDFGAFMKFSIPSKSTDKDMSGKKAEPEEIEGLIHVSELDWKLIEDPFEIVKMGQKVKAKIIDISNGKVSLSLKALKENPWENIEKKHKKGDVIQGEVSKLNPFGAFVKITPEIQGLIHISEFGDQTKMKQTLKIGKKYKFEILLINPKEYRINLKLASE